MPRPYNHALDWEEEKAEDPVEEREKPLTLDDIAVGNKFTIHEYGKPDGPVFKIVTLGDTTQVVPGDSSLYKAKVDFTLGDSPQTKSGTIYDSRGKISGGLALHTDEFRFVSFTPAPSGGRKSRRVKKRHVSRRAKHRTRRSKS